MPSPLSLRESGGLMEQHQRWVAARARLSPIRPRIVLVVENPVAGEPQPVPSVQEAEFGAPVNLLLPPSYRAIVRLVALKFGVEVSALLGPSRARALARVRHEAVGLIHEHCEMSLPQIGKAFGRDHTTILHSLICFAQNHPTSKTAKHYLKSKRLVRLKRRANKKDRHSIEGAAKCQ